MKHILLITVFFISALFYTACNPTVNKTEEALSTEPVAKADSVGNISEPAKDTAGKSGTAEVKKESPLVFIYNFHVTNRCQSCIAIEDATTKTLNTYFSAEVKQGRIKRQVLNVDDDFNRAISEKYQAFGSGVYVTRVFKGKETTTDLTGDGFKFAKNKEEKFIEILKNKITEYLK